MTGTPAWGLDLAAPCVYFLGSQGGRKAKEAPSPQGGSAEHNGVSILPVSGALVPVPPSMGLPVASPLEPPGGALPFPGGAMLPSQQGTPLPPPSSQQCGFCLLRCLWYFARTTKTNWVAETTENLLSHSSGGCTASDGRLQNVELWACGSAAPVSSSVFKGLMVFLGTHVSLSKFPPFIRIPVTLD